MATGELPRALVCDNSALLAISSNCSSDQEFSRPSCDGDVEKIASILTKEGVVRVQNCSTVTTASEQCTKKGLQDAIGKQVSKIQATPETDGLFIFVYCGGACSLEPLTDVKMPTEDDGFVTVDFLPMSCKYSLVLTDFDSDKLETYVTGKTIANAINSSPTSPKQLLVILDCPYAEEIGDDIKSHLNPCELSLIVSQGKGIASHYLSPLGSSTFSYFFSSFLSGNSTTGIIKLRSLLPKVADCCNALSSLRMVPTRDGKFLISAKATPKGRFEQIIKSAVDEMKQIEEKPDVQPDGASDEQTDYKGAMSISQFISLYYKKYWINFKPVRLCNEAIDYVYAVRDGPLSVLHEHGQLTDGKVLKAIVGSMMASIATIQGEFQESKSSNIFIQAYVYVVAAIDILDDNLELFDASLLKCAQEFYCGVLDANNTDGREIRELHM